jgi:adenylate cyclase
MGAMSEREQLRRVRRFLPPHVMTLITTRSEEELLAFEQREITVVFCDLRGFTAFAHTAASAEIVDVLGAYHRGVGPLIVAAGGILERFTGDGLMVYFDGAPLREHALRAIVMALRMRDVAGELATGWRRRGHHLSLGIGVALGQATLGPIGFKQRRDFAAIGPVTNLASRLCADAAAGQVLVTERLYTDLHDVLEAEPLGARWLKGFTAAVNVYSVRAVETKTYMKSPKRTLTAPGRPAEAASQWH